MATKEEMDQVVEVQRMAMTISAQGSFQVHTCYWGHTDELRVWAGVDGWQHGDHVFYLGADSAISIGRLGKCAEDLADRFLVTDSDGVPL